MYVQRFCSRPWAAFRYLLLSLAALNLGAACVPPPPPAATTTNDIEPNNSFDTAVDVVFNSSGHANLRGSISTVDDVDVYSLGSFSAGDQLIVDVSGSSQLDSAIAVFDEAGRLAFENDDRNVNLNQLDPFLNVIIRRDSSTYFVAITSSPQGPSVGTYEISISRTTGGAAPIPSQQIVALNFVGGSIVVDGTLYTPGPFNTADIDPRYAGMTSTVQRKILEVVRQNYNGLALDVRVIPDDPVPSDCTASTVFFGDSEPGIFGISQEVDPYNSNKCDESIIFTDQFTPRYFGILTADQLGTAIGNVASHEVGHLLGLNHVADPTDLMDDTGAPVTLLNDQKFKDSPLDPTIFPIGTQDGLLLLLDTIGPAN